MAGSEKHTTAVHNISYSIFVKSETPTTAKKDIPRKLFRHHDEARKTIEKIISRYNRQRPHTSLNYLTPEAAHVGEGTIPKRWRKYKKSTKPI